MPKKNIKRTTNNATTNTINLNGKLSWMLNHPFRVLAFILAGSTTVIFSDTIRKIFGRHHLQNQSIPTLEGNSKEFTQAKDGLIPNVGGHLEEFTQPQNQLISCGSNLDEFVPKASLCYPIVKLMVLKDCVGVGNISPSFAQINGYVYATACCMSANMPPEKCSNMPGIINSPKLAKQTKLPTKLVGIDFVEEGKYAIVDFKQSIATVGISFCVGVAITNSNPTKVLLAHVNAENNILAHDHYLKGKFEDPFMVIKNFIANSNLDNWKVTLVGGHIENIVHIKTALENMGLNHIDSYYEPDWSISYDKNKVNKGAIMIKEGQPFIIKNPQDFEHLIASIPADQKGKPAALKLQDKPASLRLR